MRKLIITIFLFSTTNAFTQSITKDDLERKVSPLSASIKALQLENSKQQTVIEKLNLKLSAANKNIDSLKIQTKANDSAINLSSERLGNKISTTENNANQKIQTLDNSLIKSTLYWVIAFLATVLLSGVVYFLLGKRIKTDKSDVEEQISKTKKVLEEEGIKLDTKLTEVLETQLKIVQAEREIKTDKISDIQIDHSFHLKGATEIMRIKNYSNTLDSQSQSYIALNDSLNRLINTYKAYDYELIDFTGQEYDDRIIIDVKDSEYDETIPFGKEVIVKTLKPQVKYKGLIIQDAQVVTRYNK